MTETQTQDNIEQGSLELIIDQNISPSSTEQQHDEEKSKLLPIDQNLAEHNNSPLKNDQYQDEESSLLYNTITSIQDVMANVAQSMTCLQNDFEIKIKYDESKDHTIDKLHQELQDHREGITFKILRPLAMELFRLYNDMQEIATTYIGDDIPKELAQARSEILDFAQTVEDILSKNGFEIYQLDTSVFDRTLQKVQKVVSTNNPELDCCIVKSISKGLRYEQRILRSEIVAVYKYVAPIVSTTESV